MSATADTRNVNRSALMQGVIIMVTFGLAWAAVGVSGLRRSTAVTVVLDLVLVAAAVATYVVAGRLRTGARGGRPRRVSPHSGRVFTLVNAGQLVLIVVAVFGLVNAGAPGLIPAAVCLVVGLHFLPLARVFDLSAYWWTGGLLTAVAVAGAGAFAADVTDAAVRSVVGFPAAVVLWSTALLVARRG